MALPLIAARVSPHQRGVRKQRDRLEILHDVVLERIDGAVGDVCVPYSQDQGVAIGRRASDPAGPDVAGSTTDILDNYGLAKRRPHAG